MSDTARCRPLLMGITSLREGLSLKPQLRATQRPESYHKDFNLGLTDREIRSLVPSIILHSLVLHAPDSFAAGAGHQDQDSRPKITQILEFSLQKPPANSQGFPLTPSLVLKLFQCLTSIICMQLLSCLMF